MGIAETIKTIVRDAAADNLQNAPKIVSAEVLGQSNGEFDIAYGTERESGVGVLRPFAGFITASRAKSVAINRQPDGNSVVVGISETHEDIDPKSLRCFSW